MKRLTTFGLSFLLAIAAGAASADVNTSHLLGAGPATAISKARARGMLAGRSGSVGAGYEQCPDTSVDVGNIVLPRGARTPREVTVVVTGDVTNVNNGSSTAFCR